MRKRRQRASRLQRFLWCVLSIFFWIVLLIAICIAFYLTKKFSVSAEELLPTLGAQTRSPQFYVYHFDDRTNRTGEREAITDDVWAGKQSTYVVYKDIPQAMIDAVVAIEDKRFFEHRGVDWYRTFAAVANYILGGDEHFGGSTLTQQLVKNLTGENAPTWKRKVQEILWARDLERRLDKTQILELYLNVVHFSDQCDGVASAAEHYFSKSVSELTPTECAAIIAITNNPSYYNPIRHPENNRARRDLILTEMYEQGYLKEEMFSTFLAADTVLCVKDSSGDGSNSWYVDMVVEDVINDLVEKYNISRSAASHLLYTGGLHIDMAMDEEIQKNVEEYYRTSVRMPKNQKGETAQSAIILIDSKTGDILGVAGAIGEKRGNRVQNFATQTKRAPGSTIKPLSVYAPALEEGIINWASVYDDVPIKFDENGRSVWPKNANNTYRGLSNIAYAVAHSTNTVALRVLEDLGLSCAYSYAKDRFHLDLVSTSSANDCDWAALGLGQLNYGVTLRQLTTAYTAFADGGVYHTWRSYYRVTDSEGNILLSNGDASERILSPETAAIMTKLLESVVENGTSSSITLQNLCACAGKTGTTQNDHDRWFVGYTPSLVCGVWCGYEYPESLEGRNLCTSIWNSIMRSIVTEKGEKREFDVPSTVTKANYCRDSGQLLADPCQKDPRGTRVESGWFTKDTLPQTFCTCHILCEACKSGGICHGHCPKEEREEVGLIRVERHFPKQVTVGDAEYVWRGDPNEISPNSNPKEAYFAANLPDYCGISGTKEQYNRSCTVHTQEENPIVEEFETEEYVRPMPWNLPKKRIKKYSPT